MKNLVKSVIIALYFGFLMVEPTHGQDLLDFLEVSQQEDEGMILPQYDYEYIPDFTYDQVKARIEAMDTEMPFELNETIFSFIHYFTVRNRGYARMILERKDTYLPLFEEALARHNMPDDIKYLAIIESGLNPRARSRVGAMGLWQFMPATGREYKLYVNSHMDDRMDPELATEAALKYLKALHRMFGDWELALAAYNCGPGNVRKAIRRSGGKHNFWQIYNYLPRETRSYIPQFQAFMYVLRYADEHNIVLEEPAFPMAYDKVKLDNTLDLEHFAQLSGICIEDLEELNPSILKRQIPQSHKHYALRIPKVKATFLAENKDWIMDSLNVKMDQLLAQQVEPYRETAAESTNRIIYRVRPGDALGSIAQRHNTTVANIKQWNSLHSNLIKVGQNLTIYTQNPALGTTLVSNSDAEGNAKVYTVQPGDSLWLISRKMEGVTIEQLKKLNNLNNNQIKPGQKLIIG
ncbi:MAG TPA: transglycosylase SLT domain-containing protein [Cyclobacteriaceae bacterium]|nr:transglycosylase SLT domain-containing protein [Cyclobacteriaceae bacterium]